MRFPCCHKKINFSTKFLKYRWGVLNLYCEDCDKYHVKIDNYLWKDEQRIDFKTTGINGYKSNTSTYPYGIIGYLRKDEFEKPKFKFMFEYDQK